LGSGNNGLNDETFDGLNKVIVCCTEAFEFP
jgi:hypothetical protein